MRANHYIFVIYWFVLLIIIGHVSAGSTTRFINKIKEKGINHLLAVKFGVVQTQYIYLNMLYSQDNQNSKFISIIETYLNHPLILTSLSTIRFSDEAKNLCENKIRVRSVTFNCTDYIKSTKLLVYHDDDNVKFSISELIMLTKFLIPLLNNFKNLSDFNLILRLDPSLKMVSEQHLSSFLEIKKLKVKECTVKAIECVGNPKTCKSGSNTQNDQDNCFGETDGSCNLSSGYFTAQRGWAYQAYCCGSCGFLSRNTCCSKLVAERSQAMSRRIEIDSALKDLPGDVSMIIQDYD
jgi:hypothetical protein